jgi:hypothetical protein
MEEPEIAGPGFINIRFKEDYLSSAVGLMAKDADGRLGVPLTRYIFSPSCRYLFLARIKLFSTSLSSIVLQ